MLRYAMYHVSSDISVSSLLDETLFGMKMGRMMNLRYAKMTHRTRNTRNCSAVVKLVSNRRSNTFTPKHMMARFVPIIMYLPYSFDNQY